MKLFKLRVVYETVVLADNADKIAIESNSILRNTDELPCEQEATEIKSARDLPDEWDVDCIPWGGERGDDRTIKEILGEGEP